jgi:uncharacterized protein YjlB
MKVDCAPELYHFEDDGATPNHPAWPLLHYRGVLRPGVTDPAVQCERLFATHGWTDSWRNGVHGFQHFHSRTHEVLGIVRGEARVQFGGEHGPTLALAAGDVVVLPAGTGHRRISASTDLLVIGAYPAGSVVDQQRPGGSSEARRMRESIDKVPRPAQDPVFGTAGPLIEAWRARG